MSRESSAKAAVRDSHKYSYIYIKVQNWWIIGMYWEMLLPKENIVGKPEHSNPR